MVCGLLGWGGGGGADLPPLLKTILGETLVVVVVVRVASFKLLTRSTLTSGFTSVTATPLFWLQLSFVFIWG